MAAARKPKPGGAPVHAPQGPSERSRGRRPSPIDAFRRQAEEQGLDAAISKLPTNRSVGIVVPADREPVQMLGEEWQIDSSRFNQWLILYFSEYTPVRVWHWMAGEAEYGGFLQTTQKKMADALSLKQQHVGSAIGALTSLNLLWMEKRGKYWLQPFVTIKGGGPKQAEALEYLASVNAPPTFLRMPVLPDPKTRPRKKKESAE
ncbi:hypothetical protein [Kitasatospora sp. NPDC090091]|uniref:hypothetical protein n=1 Tax=Kitasatospora sp. NPDC090091 TaxID=3364081 RepID=UPI0038294E70